MFFTEIKNMNASFVTRYVQKDQIFTNISRQHINKKTFISKQKRVDLVSRLYSKGLVGENVEGLKRGKMS